MVNFKSIHNVSKHGLTHGRERTLRSPLRENHDDHSVHAANVKALLLGFCWRSAVHRANP